MKLKTRGIHTAFLVLGAAVLFSCGVTFKEVGPEELKALWENTRHHSAESWWYAGTEGGYHHLVRRRPGEQAGYRVPTSSLLIRVPERPLSQKRGDWHNLKSGEVEFQKE